MTDKPKVTEADRRAAARIEGTCIGLEETLQASATRRQIADWIAEAMQPEREAAAKLAEALEIAAEHLESLEMCLSCRYYRKGCPEFTDAEFEAVRPCPGHKHVDTLEAENITDTLAKIAPALAAWKEAQK